MGKTEQRKPFYERRGFQGTTAVVALVTALIALAGPLNSLVKGLFPSSPQPVSWVQVVLDTSDAMAKDFEGETRLEAAVGAIEKTVKELDNEGLGLRRTAVDCKGESKQLVALGADHAAAVVDEAKGLQPEGKASIVDAVVGALDEFNGEPMARGRPESRRLFVFMAGTDGCYGDDLSKELAIALEGANISKASRVEMIALGASDEEVAQLDALKAVLKEYAHVEVQAPQNGEELDEFAESAGESVGETSEQIEEEKANNYEEAGE